MSFLLVLFPFVIALLANVTSYVDIAIFCYYAYMSLFYVLSISLFKL